VATPIEDRLAVVSDENLELVRRRFAAALEDDWETALEALDPDVEIHDFDIPDAGGIYRGHQGYREWVKRWTEGWESTRMENPEFRAVGDDCVVALFRMITIGEHSGLELERDDAVVYRIRGGKIVRVEYYNDQEQALEAVRRGA
jgi:ketosteroid isomerase-like protein